ncbi:MAG TPA: hypothetical protein VFJ97_13910 [Dermatophilaceae bacterium]|nr:hypothetical protein [Dermatophilaceae bacterium]
MDPNTTDRRGPDQAMVNQFPMPGRRLEQAYRELAIVLDGTDEQKQALGDPWLLPRPWDPDTLTHAPLRRELWDWLEAFTIWLNVDYVWDVSGMIPACWPDHPHLVRELAVLADQRRRAAREFSSDTIEEWHRYALPAFLERMRARIKDRCDDGHQQWPAKGRHNRHTGPAARQERQRTFTQDAAAVGHRTEPPGPARPALRLHVVDGVLVDSATGEVLNSPG